MALITLADGFKEGCDCVPAVAVCVCGHTPPSAAGVEVSEMQDGDQAVKPQNRGGCC